MTWRTAKSLLVLSAEINAYAPHRATGYDGTIGDADHEARASAHNPNDAGVVCAKDFTHSPSTGFDAHKWARRQTTKPPPALCYIISNGQVARWSNGWQWVTYKGPNPHKTHAHVRVGRGYDSEPTNAALYDSTSLWGVVALMVTTPPKETIEQWMDRTIFKPRDSELTGTLITKAAADYGLKPLWLLIVTGAETSCGRKSDGAIVTQAHNYGCIRESSRTTKWGMLALPDPLVLPDGRRFFKFPDPKTGLAGLGRLLKVGPPDSAGLYLRQLKVRDWHGFALTYYGKNVPGVAAYEANLLAIEAGFKAKANAAGWKW